MKITLQGGIIDPHDTEEDFSNLENGSYDSLMGEASGAGVIFGNTGGVMEAALRTVADVLTGEDIENVEYTAVRGVDADIKEATVQIGDLAVKVAVAHGTASARKLLDMLNAGEVDYHFIEVMGCSGGCVTGGGQPQVAAKVKELVDVRVLRAGALYEEDMVLEARKSHKNTQIQKLYKEFLGEPNSHKAHELLHTHYHAREKFPIKK